MNVEEEDDDDNDDDNTCSVFQNNGCNERIIVARTDRQRHGLNIYSLNENVKRKQK
jgi:hypothetical protein